MDAGLPVLTDRLGPGLGDVPLWALTALDMLGEKARPALPAIRTVKDAKVSRHAKGLAAHLAARLDGK